MKQVSLSYVGIPPKWELQYANKDLLVASKSTSNSLSFLLLRTFLLTSVLLNHPAFVWNIFVQKTYVV